MCGIAGFNWKDEGLAQKMSECLLHRGPDAEGVFSEDGVTLSHRRLSIIDLSPEANQPMEDNTRNLVIIFNGEIYNYKELKEDLKDHYEFKTQSDTEVILAGYSMWGKEVVKKLNGIFVFAIWDKKTKELFIARDHMGVKPLYYYWNKEKFIFASEIKAILAAPISRKLNLMAFQEFMRVLYVPEPSTMIEHIYKLPPGHIILFKNGSLICEKFYVPELRHKPISYQEAVTCVRNEIEEAVSRQMVADVPVGVYLSGGIDSSAILASATKIKKNIKTFSVGFDLEENEEIEKFNRDSSLANETARHFGADHHELILTSHDVAESLETVVGNIDDPISNPTAIAMAHLSRFAKREVTVVLSGNGGDELFGGYERYRMNRRADMVDRIPGARLVLPERIKKAVKMSSLERLAQFEFEKDYRLERVLHKKFFVSGKVIEQRFAKYIEGITDNTEALMMADLRSWLPDQALSLGDRMSMYGSVEERVPFLDREVVDLALSLPLGYKVTPFTTKKILKDAFRGELPDMLFKEPKRGWFSPGAKWLRRPEILSIVRRVLSEGYNKETATLFEWKEVEKMLDDHVEKRSYNLTILWAIVTFQIWAKRYSITT